MSAPPSIDFTTFYQQLDKLKSREVDRAGEMIKIPSGGSIYRQDAAPDAVYII